jgi:hypothetical protein
MTAERIDQPREGFFEMRLCRDGPWIGVRFWRDNDGTMLAEIDGEPADDVFDTWCRCGSRPITLIEFTYRAMVRDWARRWDPSHPRANPRVPVDLSDIRPRF